MKIVIINASPRKNGATVRVLSEFAGQLEHKDADIAMFHLTDLDMAFCNGCCNCYKTGRCIFDDGAEMLSQTISGADALIVATPCYASNISGLLKAFIDRGHFVIEQLLTNKRAMGIVTYENAGGGSAYKTLKNLFVFSGASTVDKLIVKTPFDSDPLENTKIKQQIARKAAKLHNSIKNNKSSFSCRIVHFFVLNFGIRPFVRKKGETYQGVVEHWKERGISHRTL